MPKLTKKCKYGSIQSRKNGGLGMQFNEALIKHYHEGMVPLEKLRTKVNINEDYLREKPTWYELGKGRLVYFKSRNDLRLFSELFFSEYAREIIGLDTVKFDVIHMRTKDPVKKQKDEERKIGLISNNFQTQDNNYYLVSELENPEISALKSYGEYSLVTLLHFFKDLLSNDDYNKVKDFLIKLFLADAFTLQVDRNHNNISFQVPKIKGVSYKQRLYPYLLSQIPEASESVTCEGCIMKIIGLEPSIVYDNERILGIDHKHQFVHEKGDVWAPLFPFNSELLFKDQDQAKEIQEIYDGYDPNLYELLNAFPEIIPIAERLAFDDEYRKILEKFHGSSMPVMLDDDEYAKITDTIEERRDVFQRILKP